MSAKALDCSLAPSLSAEKYVVAEFFADFPVARSAWHAYMVC